MEDTIREKLVEALKPQRLEVINESYLHSGHAGDNGTGETHFRVLVASPELAALTRVEGQRKIYDILKNELKNGIHALSIKITKD